MFTEEYIEEVGKNLNSAMDEAVLRLNELSKMLTDLSEYKENPALFHKDKNGKLHRVA